MSDGDITTCPYKTDLRILKKVKQLKDKAMREEEQIREILIKIANAFGEPYR